MKSRSWGFNKECDSPKREKPRRKTDRRLRSNQTGVGIEKIRK